jgi:predicted GIY-YIG superfamily endonuclease
MSTTMPNESPFCIFESGTVYLCCSRRRYQTSTGRLVHLHYVGATEDFRKRIQAHRRGTGARLLAVLNEAGVRWSVVRTWTFERSAEAWEFEKKVKRAKNHSKFCPRCKSKYRRRENRRARAAKGQNGRGGGQRGK